MSKNKPITELRNIGKTVAARLHEIGITNHADLKQSGAANTYKYLSEKFPEKHLPVCYYLYSLEGAIQDKKWDDFSEQEKTQLRLEAGLLK